MEEVLEVYRRVYDVRFPQVCVDEGSKQLVSCTRESLPMEPGKPERVDYEYEREGFCSVFVACEPLAGKRIVQARPRRTACEWAEFMRELVEVHYAQAEKIVVVMDNLNTHTIASLYQAFQPAHALAIASKLELHYTPVHGSWLNMAEIELSVLARQALSGRVGSVQEVQQRVDEWQQRRNREQAGIQWRFTTQEARITLHHLYPKVTHVL
jgi:hypothetical protein